MTEGNVKNKGNKTKENSGYKGENSEVEDKGEKLEIVFAKVDEVGVEGGDEEEAGGKDEGGEDKGGHI